jgi:hypothetical protein
MNYTHTKILTHGEEERLQKSIQRNTIIVGGGHPNTTDIKLLENPHLPLYNSSRPTSSTRHKEEHNFPDVVAGVEASNPMYGEKLSVMAAGWFCEKSG